MLYIGLAKLESMKAMHPQIAVKLYHNMVRSAARLMNKKSDLLAKLIYLKDLSDKNKNEDLDLLADLDMTLMTANEVLGTGSSAAEDHNRRMSFLQKDPSGLATGSQRNLMRYLQTSATPHSAVVERADAADTAGPPRKEYLLEVCPAAQPGQLRES